jgi:hypothetical protein
VIAVAIGTTFSSPSALVEMSFVPRLRNASIESVLGRWCFLFL